MKFIHLLCAVSALSISACASTKTKPVSEVPAVAVKEKRAYGDALPLVCEASIAAEGKLQERPNLQIMWENFLHEKPDGVWKEIGGMVAVNGNLPLEQGRWTNACTVRLSHMFNKAGYLIDSGNGKTVSGENYDQYYYRVTDFEEYLYEEFGAPDVNVDDGSGNQYDLPAVPGIVLMDFPDSSFTGHVTVWNGKETVDGVNIGGYRVLFWKLPCFIPKDRASTSIAATTG